MNVKIAAVCLIALQASCLSALAQNSNPMDAIYACTSEAEDTRRLICFDEAVAAMRAKEDAGLFQTVDVAEIKQIEREAFGFSMPSLPSLFRRTDDPVEPAAGDKELTEIVSAVRTARIEDFTGKLIVTLENGQTWEQIDSSRVRASAARNAKEAIIRKATFGSFLMTIDGSRAIRVRRLK
jgi:hypothetical protein